jgi:hypothetical protein
VSAVLAVSPSGADWHDAMKAITARDKIVFFIFYIFIRLQIYIKYCMLQHIF